MELKQNLLIVACAVFFIGFGCLLGDQPEMAMGLAVASATIMAYYFWLDRKDKKKNGLTIDQAIWISNTITARIYLDKSEILDRVNKELKFQDPDQERKVKNYLRKYYNSLVEELPSVLEMMHENIEN